MLKKRKALGSSKVSNSYAVTIIKEVIKELKTKSGESIGFFQVPKTKEIVILAGQISGEFYLLGAHKLSSQNSVTIPEKVRQLLEIQKGDNIMFYLDKKEHQVYIES